MHLTPDATSYLRSERERRQRLVEQAAPPRRDPRRRAGPVRASSSGTRVHAGPSALAPFVMRVALTAGGSA